MIRDIVTIYNEEKPPFSYRTIETPIVLAKTKECMAKFMIWKIKRIVVDFFIRI